MHTNQRAARPEMVGRQKTAQRQYRHANVPAKHYSRFALSNDFKGWPVSGNHRIRDCFLRGALPLGHSDHGQRRRDGYAGGGHMKAIRSPYTTERTMSAAHIESGREMATKVHRWMEANEAAFRKIYGFVKEMQRTGGRGRVRDRVAAFCVDQSIEVGDEPTPSTTRGGPESLGTSCSTTRPCLKTQSDSETRTSTATACCRLATCPRSSRTSR